VAPGSPQDCATIEKERNPAKWHPVRHQIARQLKKSAIAGS
jgi:hypothetical protein